MNRSTVLKHLLQFLNSNCNYAILHHSKEIFITKNDIDFIVDCDFKIIKNLIFEFAKKQSGFIINIYSIDVNIFRFDLVFFDDFDKKWELFELDCCIKNKAKDLLLLDSEELLEDRTLVAVNGVKFYSIKSSKECDYYIKKKAYKNESIQSHLPYLLNLDKTLSENKIYESYNFYRNYYSSYNYLLKKLYNKLNLTLRRLKEHPSISVGIMSPDKNLKSQLVNSILGTNFFRSTYSFRLNPLISFQKNYKLKVGGTNLDNNLVSNRKRSYFNLMLLIHKYIFISIRNYFLFGLKSSIIMYDGYYEDLIINPYPYGYRGKGVLLKSFYRLIPRNTISFIIIKDSDLSFSQDLEIINEPEKMEMNYKKMVNNSKFYQLDGTKTSMELKNNFIKIISFKMDKYLRFKYS